MSSSLLILGAGGNAKVVAEIALQTWKKIAFLDDDPDCDTIYGCPIIGSIQSIAKYQQDFSHAFVSIGDPKKRLDLILALEECGYLIPNLIHRSAILSKHTVIGSGVMIAAGAVINPFADIATGCMINTHSVVEHDCVLAEGVHIAPGAVLGGNVHIGKRSWIGLGSRINQNIVITSDVMIGSGAVVVRDIQKSGTYVGVPARAIR